jgi:hypothetical protein
VIITAACGDDEAPPKGNCLKAGYASEQDARTLCGCEHAFVKCSGAGAAVTRSDCLCVADKGTCTAETDGLVFCGAERTGYQCRNGAFTSMLQCPGTGSCLNNGTNDRITCGTQQSHIDYAVEGQPCASEQAGACSIDQASVLNCQRGTWVTGRSCATGLTRCERVFSGDPGVNCPGGSASCVGCGAQ